VRQCAAPEKGTEKTEEGLTDLFCCARPRRDRLQQEKGPPMRSTRTRFLDLTATSSRMVSAPSGSPPAPGCGWSFTDPGKTQGYVCP
jgi:hypothetical protein